VCDWLTRDPPEEGPLSQNRGNSSKSGKAKELFARQLEPRMWQHGLGPVKGKRTTKGGSG